MENFTISILCYTMADNLLNEIGLIDDSGYFRSIEVNLNADDSALLGKAKTTFNEEYKTELNNDKWKYLGEMQRENGGKSIYCFAADVSGHKPTGIKLFGLNKISKVSDAICQASFFRLFSLLYKKDILH